MKQLYMCINMVTAWKGNEPLYFDTPISIKPAPHLFPFNIWGVQVSPGNTLYVMDADQEWLVLSGETQAEVMIIGSLYQRLQLIENNYVKKEETI